MVDMTEYRKELEKHAKDGSPQFINNSSKDHASVMIEELFRNAKGKAYIFTGHLEENVYDRPTLRQATANFLSKPDSSIDVILQLNGASDKANLCQNKYVSFLKNFDGKVRLYEANIQALKDKTMHFMIVKTTLDNYALRLEHDINNHVATGTFNIGEIGEDYLNFFDDCLANKVTQIP